MGGDLPAIVDAMGPEGLVCASDLEPEFVIACQRQARPYQPDSNRPFLSACDALNLPFPDDSFDGAFHFGGINQFGDIRSSILEMERVVRPGGRVVFGDEGVAPFPLRSAEAPLALLPRNAVDVHVSWVLGNCFYLVDFEVSDAGPFMNIDVRHEGPRGGTMRTRYFGRLEGVSEASKPFVLADGERRGISVDEWLEQVINERRQR